MNHTNVEDPQCMKRERMTHNDAWEHDVQRGMTHMHTKEHNTTATHLQKRGHKQRKGDARKSKNMEHTNDRREPTTPEEHPKCVQDTRNTEEQPP